MPKHVAEKLDAQQIIIIEDSPPASPSRASTPTHDAPINAAEKMEAQEIIIIEDTPPSSSLRVSTSTHVISMVPNNAAEKMEAQQLFNIEDTPPTTPLHASTITHDASAVPKGCQRNTQSKVHTTAPRQITVTASPITNIISSIVNWNVECFRQNTAHYGTFPKLTNYKDIAHWKKCVFFTSIHFFSSFCSLCSASPASGD